jgi:uracil-DNA glycosylase
MTMSWAGLETVLDAGWLANLSGEFEKHYMQELRAFLLSEQAVGKRIFPKDNQLFNALAHTPLDKVKVVILGQDPYHGEGQAHGLCFSVRDGVRPPPSLKNVFKEVHRDVEMAIPEGGNLTAWADRGVLLLNSVLSVECGAAASHQGRGWEQFTDRIIEVINRERKGVVFMLWGAYAQRKGAIIDPLRHCVLKATHPSPLSAHRGFLGCGHFSAANAYFQTRGESAIDWSLS